MGEITLEYLKNYIFEKTGLEEVLFERPKVSGRFSEKELLMLPSSEEEKMEELNIKISDLIHDKFVVGCKLSLKNCYVKKNWWISA